jgi:hypothetical protein
VGYWKGIAISSIGSSIGGGCCNETSIRVGGEAGLDGFEVEERLSSSCASSSKTS